MSDIEKIVITSSLTIFGGLMIHILSQIFIKLFLEPCTEFKKAKSNVITHLTFYSNMLDSKLRKDEKSEYIERFHKAQDDIRLSMAEFRSAYHAISFRYLAVWLSIAPRYDVFNEITQNLLTISFLGSLKENDSFSFENSNLAEKTINLLGVKSN